MASSADANYTFIPKDWTCPADVDYLHITTNNTIYGTEMRKDLDVPVPMVADMSSDIFSRPVDVSKYMCIYAGAQKNLSMAGVTVVIVKDDALGKAPRAIPTMLDYKTHVDKGSMFNTPPVVPIYTALENLRWIKKMGGVEAMDKRAQERADMLYGEIDRNKGVPRHGCYGRPLCDEHMLCDERRVRRSREAVPRVRYGSRHGRHKGTPLCWRIPCKLLQRPDG